MSHPAVWFGLYAVLVVAVCLLFRFAIPAALNAWRIRQLPRLLAQGDPLVDDALFVNLALCLPFSYQNLFKLDAHYFGRFKLSYHCHGDDRKLYLSDLYTDTTLHVFRMVPGIRPWYVYSMLDPQKSPAPDIRALVIEHVKNYLPATLGVAA